MTDRSQSPDFPFYNQNVRTDPATLLPLKYFHIFCKQSWLQKICNYFNGKNVAGSVRTRWL
jgi:hypothetical protein